MSRWEYNQRESVRRSEANWRAENPHIDTEVWEIDPAHHQIYVSPKQANLSDIKRDFEHRYAQAADFVTMVDERPENAIRIASISDKNWSTGFAGTPLTVADTQVLLAGKFPDAPLLASAGPDGNGSLDYAFEAPLPDGLWDEIKVVLEPNTKGMTPRLVNPQPLESQIDERQAEGNLFKPAKLRCQVPEFVAKDEAWWFDEVETLYEGRLSPRAFGFTDDADMACYVDASIWPTVDLRQLLLAFDTIYMTPPITDGSAGDRFWETQTIDQTGLLQMIEADRVRLLLSHPEERYDVDFLSRAQALNLRGVLSRRKSAAFYISNIVEMDDWFLFSDPALRSDLQLVIKRLVAELNISDKEVAAWLFYPRMARRNSFPYTMSQGLLGIQGFGQGRHFGDSLHRITGKDGRLEAMTFGTQVEIARMLDATFIPPNSPNYVTTWHEPMRIIGDRLNFFRHFRRGISARWATNERRKRKESATLLPPLPLMTFHPAATVDDVLAYTSQTSLRRKGRSLITRLAELPEEERRQELDRLERELYEDKLGKRKWLDRRDVLDLSAPLVSAGTGLPLTTFLGAWDMLQSILRVARRAPALDRLVEVVEEAISDKVQINDALSFLSKMDPVATIRKE
ncbi:MAG: hypothetical protein K5905_00450 [Roseibium sp.]|uniref:hypothetical protein n=1 Tax=Roseibium sp. TaxID=1936156 RepID=UPI00260C8156|nr:hypothetical protein [Roseibium sp.]MCV0423918.1 hypothetical protein [Roseibium sp.]